jgi:hypothetical protein
LEKLMHKQKARALMYERSECVSALDPSISRVHPNTISKYDEAPSSVARSQVLEIVAAKTGARGVLWLDKHPRIDGNRTRRGGFHPNGSPPRYETRHSRSSMLAP